MPDQNKEGSSSHSPSSLSRDSAQPKNTEINIVVACSLAGDDSDAIEEAWKSMLNQLGGTHPDFIIIYCDSHVDSHRARSILRENREQSDIACPMFGGTSAHGILTANISLARVALCAFSNFAQRVAIGHAKHANVPAEALEAGEASALAATNQMCSLQTNLLFVVPSLGAEERVLDGIRNICRSTPIFGGTPAHDALHNPKHPGTAFQIFATEDSWDVVIGTDMVIVVAIALCNNARIHSTFTHCHGQGKRHKGVITRVERRGRVLMEIDDRPALDIFNEWDASVFASRGEDGVLEDSALHPLQVGKDDGIQTDFRTVHLHSLLADGGVECFGRMNVNDTVWLLNSPPLEVTQKLENLSKRIITDCTFEPKMALVDFCAGYAAVLPGLDDLRDVLVANLPNCFCFFSFGEQGDINGESAHGNLMINIMLMGEAHSGDAKLHKSDR